MKKFVFLIAAAALSTGAFAQVDLGVKGGLNLANFTDGASMKPSFYLGGFAEYTFNSFFGVQAEVVYSRQGLFDKEDGDKMWLRYNYLNIPILAKIYVLPQLSLDLGPQFGILLNSKMKMKSGGVTATVDYDTAKSFDVSVPIGLSYRITDNIEVSGRYLIGLTKVSEDIAGFEVKSKNSVIQLGVGYRF